MAHRTSLCFAPFQWIFLSLINFISYNGIHWLSLLQTIRWAHFRCDSLGPNWIFIRSFIPCGYLVHQQHCKSSYLCVLGQSAHISTACLEQSKVCADNWSCTCCFCFSVVFMDFPDCYKLCFCLLVPLLRVLALRGTSVESTVFVLDFVPILVFLSHAFCTQKDIFHCIPISETKEVFLCHTSAKKTTVLQSSMVFQSPQQNLVAGFWLF